jgi:hypothetical protein
MSSALQWDCGGPFDLEDRHTITNWETMPTSRAESTIIAWLKAHPERYRGRRLLHAGIGNSELPAAFGHDLGDYVGFTISMPEVRRFHELFPESPHMRCILMNKYDPRMHGAVAGAFDVVVDTLLKGYTCCERHFHDMLDWYAARLAHGGAIVTTENGLRWGWPGNQARAYTPGAQTEPTIAAARTMAHDELEAHARARGLDTWFENHAEWLAAPDGSDSLVLLTKGAGSRPTGTVGRRVDGAVLPPDIVA